MYRIIAIAVALGMLGYAFFLALNNPYLPKVTAPTQVAVGEQGRSAEKASTSDKISTDQQVRPASCQLSFNPPTIEVGQTSTLSYTSENAITGVIDGVSLTGLAGSKVVTPGEKDTSITARGIFTDAAGKGVLCEAALNIVPKGALGNSGPSWWEQRWTEFTSMLDKLFNYVAPTNGKIPNLAKDLGVNYWLLLAGVIALVFVGLHWLWKIAKTPIVAGGGVAAASRSSGIFTKVVLMAALVVAAIVYFPDTVNSIIGKVSDATTYKYVSADCKGPIGTNGRIIIDGQWGLVNPNETCIFVSDFAPGSVQFLDRQGPYLATEITNRAMSAIRSVSGAEMRGYASLCAKSGSSNPALNLDCSVKR